MKRVTYFTEQASPGCHFFAISRHGPLNEPDDLLQWAQDHHGVWRWMPSQKLVQWLWDNGYTRETVTIVPVTDCVLISVKDNEDLAFAFRLNFC